LTSALCYPDLVASYYTLAGAGFGAAAAVPFRDRVRAAHAAGFRGIGLVVDDWPAVLADGSSPAELRSFADDHGVAVAEVEFLMGWSGGDDSTARETEERLYEIAEVFGARHLNVGATEPPGALPPIADVAERFAGICDRAGQHGLLVGIEFMPFIAVSDVTRAHEIVAAAGRPNGGIVLDAYHFFRGNPDLDALRAVPGDRIVCVQLCDAAPETPSMPLYDETTHHRLVPGHGSFNLVGLLSSLRDMGVRAPYSVEILSDELWSQPVDGVARRAYDATRALINQAETQAPLPQDEGEPA
jgi:sugar phosphate isomerase/epimerase